MKILYCNPSFWEYRLPFYKYLNELWNGTFSVIYSTKRYKGAHFSMLETIKRELGKSAIPYDNECFFDTVSKTFDKPSEEYHPIAISFGLWKRIKQIKPNVLITEGYLQWTPWVILYSILYHIPVFMGYERTLWTERNNSKLKTWHRKLTDKFITGYLVNGSETKKYLLSIGVKEEKIIVTGMCADGSGLRAGINAMDSNEREEMATKYKKEGGIMYLFCGALIKRKGVKPLLTAWTEHIKTYYKDTLVLVGGGELQDKIISMYGSSPSIFIEGRKEYQEVCKYYGIADVFVLPTIEDNWSLVIPEAMSCGLPVATSIYNGCYPELVHEGENGCTFDTFNQDSIRRALDYFHHVNLKLHGLRSLEIEKKFNTETCAKREYEGIMNLLKEKWL